MQEHQSILIAPKFGSLGEAVYFSAIHHALCPSPRQCPSPLELNLEFVSNTQDTAVASRPLSDLTGSRTPTPSTRSSRLPHGLRVDRQRRSGLASTGNARALITPHSSPRPACLYHYSLCLAVRTPAAASDSCVFAVVIARRVHAAVCPRLHSAMRGWSGSPCAASLYPRAPSDSTCSRRHGAAGVGDLTGGRDGWQ